MFDRALKPFLVRKECPGTGDLIDQCVSEYFKQIKQVCLFDLILYVPVSINSLIRVFNICYSGKHFVNSIPEKQHIVEESIHNFRTFTVYGISTNI